MKEACSAALEELRASRRLIEVLDRENAMLRERLETEKRTTATLSELHETRRSEAESLHAAVAAKNETIAAKDLLIASQERLIEDLKKKRSSPLKRLGDILIGVAAGALIR